MTRQLIITIESYDKDIGDHLTSHEGTFSISPHNLKQIRQVLRRMYDHPESKFSIKIKRKGL